MSLALALVLILLALGIAITQSIPDSKSVTLAWLRLGDLITLPLLAVAAVVVTRDPGPHSPNGLLTLLVISTLLLGGIIHIILTQLGKRKAQRLAITITILLTSLIIITPSLIPSDQFTPPLAVTFTNQAQQITYQSFSQQTRILLIGIAQILAAFLIGGAIHTMLLGHAYLTAANEMTQKPFLRLTRALLLIILIRGLSASILAALPWYQHITATSSDLQSPNITWPAMLITARFAVGIIVPAIMVWMAHQCVKIRSNQSATGILYVAGLMLLVGELTAIALWSETALPF